MYYKIANTESEIYKTMAEVRALEKGIEYLNMKSIKENSLIPEFTAYIGSVGQNNLMRVTQYEGFVFSGNVDSTIWTRDRKVKRGVYRPNRRTKEGRKMFNWLHSLLHGNALQVLSAFGIDTSHSKITPPFIEVYDDVMVCCFGNDQQPTVDGLEPITQEEFTNIINEHNATK